MNNVSPLIVPLDQVSLLEELTELSELLHYCVHDGASISFVLPFSVDDSRNYWLSQVLPKLNNSNRILLVAKLAGKIAGTVQLDYATPPNQPHRAEVAKLLVSPVFQRKGIARQLMRALEELAQQLGRNLLTLDTRTGDKAEPLYLSLGYQIAGIIPHFAKDPLVDRLDATTIMYKKLE